MTCGVLPFDPEKHWDRTHKCWRLFLRIGHASLRGRSWKISQSILGCGVYQTNYLILTDWSWLIHGNQIARKLRKLHIHHEDTYGLSCRTCKTTSKKLLSFQLLLPFHLWGWKASKQTKKKHEVQLGPPAARPSQVCKSGGWWSFQLAASGCT